MLLTILLAAHIVLAILLISVILIQQGKGATAGAAFGSGASSTVFGARGSASVLTRITSVLAVLFLSNSLVLAYLYGQTTQAQSFLDQIANAPASVVGEPAESAAEVTPAALPADAPPIEVATDNAALPNDLPPIPASPATNETPPTNEAPPAQ